MDGGTTGRAGPAGRGAPVGGGGPVGRGAPIGRGGPAGRGGRRRALHRWTHGWRRAVALRRAAAAVLVVLAVVLAARPAAAPPTGRVVIARHDLAPGVALGPGDVEVRAVPDDAVPGGALPAAEPALGRTTVGPVRAGEVLTDVRFVGPEAAVVAAGTPDAAGVPLRLADPAVAGLVHPGARVDIVGAGGVGTGAGGGGPGAGAPAAATDGSAVLLASGAVVLGVLPAVERTATGPVVVVALPGPDAARVAAATLGREVTVTLR